MNIKYLLVEISPLQDDFSSELEQIMHYGICNYTNKFVEIPVSVCFSSLLCP